MQIFIIILAFLLFIGLILIHEWGHYIVARRNGVKVEEFGLGLPPRAWGKRKKSGMILSLNWLPLGGFVKLKGEHDAATGRGSFGAASLGAKTKILLAGITMNLLAGLAILTVLAFIGLPKIITSQNLGEEQFSVASDTKIVHSEVIASAVQPGSPADKIGIKQRDAIVAISGGGQTENISEVKQLQTATRSFAGQQVQVTYKHNGKLLTKTTTLLSEGQVQASLKANKPKGYLGITDPINFQILRSSWSAPVVAVGFTGQLVKLTLEGLWHALSGLGSIIAGSLTGNEEARKNGQTIASSQVGGPVAIGAVLWNSGSLGLYFMLMVIAVISLTLALINALPIPALDGGRLTVILISRAFRTRLSKSTEELIHGAGMAVLLGLILLITIVDVKRFL